MVFVRKKKPSVMSIKKQTGLFTYQNQRFTSNIRDQAALTW